MPRDNATLDLFAPAQRADEMEQIEELIRAGALFICNHSGGKDSQAMHIRLRQIVPPEQLIVIHAELPGVEWKDTETHARATTVGFRFELVRAGKTFLEMVEARGYWPSPQFRQCTSDLKRGPIERRIRQLVKETGRNLVVSCMGLRAEESSNRAAQATFRRSERNSKAGREWFEWLPIHGMTTAEVFASIAASGETPHWAYAAGMSRLSCCFCIMSSLADLRTAAKLNPALFRRYVEMERRIDQTFVMPGKAGRRFLTEIVGELEAA